MGTNLNSPNVSVLYSFSLILVMRSICCTPSPTGITMMPPTFSCWKRAGGTLGAPQVDFQLVIQQDAGPAEKIQLPLDAVNFSPHGGKDGRLETRSGADFQHLLVGMNVQQLRLERHGDRLRDGLAATDGQRCVLVGTIQQNSIGDEAMPLHHVKGVEYILISDTLLAQPRNE